MHRVDAPSLSELQAIAERGLDALDASGQALAVWERGRGLTITLTAVVDGRGGEAIAHDPDELPRAGKAAALHARRARAWPVAALPEPRDARSHAGFDPRALTAAASTEQVDGLTVRLEAGAARTAVASSTGVRAAEQRSHHLVRVDGAVDGRAVSVVRVAVGALDPEDALGEARALLEAGSGEQAPTGGPVVLGHAAVAWILDRLRPAFGVDLALGGGPLAGRRGAPIAARGVELADDAHHPEVLPRAHDAEGVPRRRVALIASGVARGAVLDSAAAAREDSESTGHSTRPGALAPYPEHLVLAAGDADDLVAGATVGVYIPALARDPHGRAVMRGAIRIGDGRLQRGIADRHVDVDPLAVLASVEALSGRRRLLPLRGHCPGGIGCALVPALRATSGVRW